MGVLQGPLGLREFNFRVKQPSSSGQEQPHAVQYDSECYVHCRAPYCRDGSKVAAMVRLISKILLMLTFAPGLAGEGKETCSLSVKPTLSTRRLSLPIPLMGSLAGVLCSPCVFFWRVLDFRTPLAALTFVVPSVNFQHGRARARC